MFINISCICMSPYTFGLYHVDYPPLRFGSLDPTLLTSKYIILFVFSIVSTDSKYIGFPRDCLLEMFPVFKGFILCLKLTQVALFNWCNVNIKRTVSIAMVYVLQVNTSSLSTFLCKNTKQLNCRNNLFKFLCFL